MIKVITYGTFDLLHEGHIKLLERAKALGDYLIVGVTSDDYDKARGKINNQQSLMERIAGIRAAGFADEIIVEEYEGQKIDDIRRYDIDIFTVGSDWDGKFDYLSEYCKVIYLPRTEGVSSSGLRAKSRKLKMGLIGSMVLLPKFEREARYVNGVEVTCVCAPESNTNTSFDNLTRIPDFSVMLDLVDAVYIATKPETHYKYVKQALECGKHVLCESPVTLSTEECMELYRIADEKKLILMDAIKTAYSTAYERLVLIVKAGKIGDIISIDSVCTSLRDDITPGSSGGAEAWNSICGWAPTGMLPIFQILGTKYDRTLFYTKFTDEQANMDAFTRIDLIYPHSVATIKVAKGAKSEGELIISGTKGYIYVPAPWWKTEYFEIRYEDPTNNKRAFYQLDGEGIRYEIVSFMKSVASGKNISYVDRDFSAAIAGVIQDFNDRRNLVII